VAVFRGMSLECKHISLSAVNFPYLEAAESWKPSYKRKMTHHRLIKNADGEFNIMPIELAYDQDQNLTTLVVDESITANEMHRALEAIFPWSH